MRAWPGERGAIPVWDGVPFFLPQEEAVNEHPLYAAAVTQIVRLERRLAVVAAGLADLRIEAAVRGLADDAPNAQRAAWGEVEGRLGRLLAAAEVAPPGVRTASGPDGVPSDGPVGGGGGVDDPFGWDPQYPIPESAFRRAEMLRWLFEECKRCDEAYNYLRLTAILAWVIRPEVGVAYLLERQLAGVEAALTGRMPKGAGDGVTGV